MEFNVYQLGIVLSAFKFLIVFLKIIKHVTQIKDNYVIVLMESIIVL